MIKSYVTLLILSFTVIFANKINASVHNSWELLDDLAFSDDEKTFSDDEKTMYRNSKMHQGTDSAWRIEAFNLREIHNLSILPLPQGEKLKVYLQEDSIFETELQRKYPNLTSYKVFSLSGGLIGRLSSGPSGINAFFRDKGNWVRVKPANTRSSDIYHSEFFQEVKGVDKFSCGADELVSNKSFSPWSTEIARLNKKSAHQHPLSSSYSEGLNALTSGDQIKTYRIAIATTAEYFQQVVANAESPGSSETEIVLENISALVNSVNAIYLIEMALQFQLVDDNDQILFSDPETDGYSNNGQEDLPVNQSTLDEIIGSENYDVGHVIGEYGGGLASLGSVCSSAFKARGASVNNLGVFAHELGHMLNSPHTFNGTEGFCGANIGLPYEPGSGSTIMSYFGLCDSQNLSGPSDEIFHVGSIDIMRRFIDFGEGASCGVTASIDNAIPTAHAGFDYTIPARTPFVLNGTSSDQDNDTLTHIWEQFESNATSSTRATMSVDDGRRVLFRSIQPVTSTQRYFPKYENVLSGYSELGETLPTTSRDMNMTFTVRDGKGGVTTDSTTIATVATKYGFNIVSPNENQPWNLTQPYMLRWHTGKSDSDAVSCSEIMVEISSDGGNSFQTLAERISNDGIERLVGRNTDVIQAGESYRLKLSCPGNVFYTVQTADFTAVNEFPEGDTDWDGMPDRLENRYGFDKEDPSDAELDADSDGYSNLDEIVMGTHPLRTDSDHDGIPDRNELAQETDPTDILSRVVDSEVTETFESEVPAFADVTSDFARTDLNAQQGTYSAVSTNSNHSSTGNYTLNTGGDNEVGYSFYYKVSSEAGWDFLNFYINNELQQQWSGEEDWKLYEGTLPGGDYELRWEYAKDASVSNGEDKAWLDNIFVSGQQEFSRPLGQKTDNFIDFTESLPLAWNNESSQPWEINNAQGVQDSVSLVSGLIGDEQVSSVGLTGYFSAQNISFFYKVSSEENFDYLEFYLNGDLMGRWSGEVEWQEFSLPISEGEHAFRWDYRKDSSVSNGEDRAWIDNVSYQLTLPNRAIGVPGDFDADAKSDLLIRDVAKAQSGYTGSANQDALLSDFGLSTDIPVTGDFDGDGYADLAIRRPSTTFWYIRNSSGIDILTQNADGRTRKRFGTQREDIPVIGDYDGDGISDIAVRRPSSQFWYVLNSSGRDLLTGNSDGISRRRFGLQSTDIPVPADYDGDGVTDLAVRRPSSQTWYILNSSGVDPIGNNADGISRVKFGTQVEDIPVPADYDGDGKADLAVRRPSTRFFYIKNSSGQDQITGNSDGITRLRFGNQSTDIPLTGDYDVDGKADIGVYRPSTGQWFIKTSSGVSRTSNDDIERWTFGNENSLPILSPITEIMKRMTILNE